MRTVGSVTPFAESRAPYRANRNYAAFLNTPSRRKEDGSMLSEADIAAQTAFAAALPLLIDCPMLGEEMSRQEQSALWEQYSGKRAVDCRSDRRDEQFCQRAAAFCRVGGVCPQRARRIGRNLQSGQRRMFLCRTRAGCVS